MGKRENREIFWANPLYFHIIYPTIILSINELLIISVDLTITMSQISKPIANHDKRSPIKRMAESI